MNLPDKLDEILKHYKYDNLYPNEANTKRLTTKQAKAAILQAFIEEAEKLVPFLDMDANSTDRFNDGFIACQTKMLSAIRDIKDILEGK